MKRLRHIAAFALGMAYFAACQAPSNPASLAKHNAAYTVTTWEPLSLIADNDRKAYLSFLERAFEHFVAEQRPEAFMQCFGAQAFGERMHLQPQFPGINRNLREIRLQSLLTERDVLHVARDPSGTIVASAALSSAWHSRDPVTLEFACPGDTKLRKAPPQSLYLNGFCSTEPGAGSALMDTMLAFVQAQARPLIVLHVDALAGFYDRFSADCTGSKRIEVFAPRWIDSVLWSTPDDTKAVNAHTKLWLPTRTPSP